MSSKNPSNRHAAITACIFLIAVCGPAAAQDDTPLQSVRDRPRPSYDPLGIQMGIWEISAGLDIGVEYSDNVLAASSGEVDDILTVLDPAVGIAADWGRSSLALTAGMSIGRYRDFSSEDYDDFAINLRGLQRIGAEGRLRIGLRSSGGHDTRRDPTDEDGLQPNKYAIEAISTGYAGRVGAVDLDLDLEAKNIDYEDTPGLNFLINNDDRDRRENRFIARFGLLAEQAISTFLEYQQDERRYDQPLDDSGVARSSEGSAIGVGIRLQPSGKLNGEVMLGQVERRYQSSQFSDNQRFWVRSALEWNPTGLTTVSLDYETRIEETTSSSTAGVEVDEIGLRVDHELLRNVVISLERRTSNEVYVAATRKDDIARWFGSVEYLASNRLRISFEIAANDRNSSASSQSFAENVYRLTLRTAL